MSDHTPDAPLAPDYYLHNFRFLLNWVNDRFRDLLTPAETGFIDSFRQLDRDGQCLLVRLATRKGPWFRGSKLSYAEIGSVGAAAGNLCSVNLLEEDPLLDIACLGRLLTKSELVDLFSAELAGYRSRRKPELLALLEARYPDIQRWSAWTASRWGPLYQFALTPVIDTLMLLFFGNPWQNLSEFVLRDLGLLRYENYRIDPDHRLFPDRASLDQYQQLLTLREALQAAANLEDLRALALSIPAVSGSDALVRRRARLCNRLAYALERAEDHELALALYAQSTLPPARERQVRLREKLGQYEQAWQQLETILAQPLDEHEQQVMLRMAPRLARKAGVSYQRKPAIGLNEKRLVLSIPGITTGDGDELALRVEDVVCRHWHQPHAPCLYAENLLFNGLLGLWLWPELFRSISGAFANPFQIAPLDLYREDFQQRRPAMQALWEQLDSGAYKAHMRQIYATRKGIANPFVNWQFLDETILDLALDCIQEGHLKAIFRRQLFDLRTNCSGFPDLIQFYPQHQTYRLIEVKAPGDRLQDNQRRWLAFFSANAIPAEVCLSLIHI